MDDFIEIASLDDVSSGFAELLLRFVLNVVVVLVVARFFYYPKSQRKDYFFTFTMISISIFMMMFLLSSVKIKTGFALGLFAIFGIIRYRTESIPVREMTYLFLLVGISVINALAELNFIGLVGANVLYMLCIWLCENSAWLKLKHVSCKLVLYDRIDLIVPEREKELIEDLKKRTGLEIIKVELGHVDFLRDSAMLRVHYIPKDGGVNLIDKLLKFPKDEENSLTL